MTRAELVGLVIETLRETQRLSGRGDSFAVTETTVPIGDLADFDSHNGLEATLAVEERIGQSLPVNLFTDDATRRPLSVGEVVDHLLSLVD
jgi:hypothetical protein